MARFLVGVNTVALQVSGGGPSSGKVLTSDIYGNATWQVASVADASITTAKLADAAVTPSKMAAGSPNQVIVAGVSGTPAFQYLAMDVPIGTVVPYIFPNAPVGFLILNGATISRSTYNDLYSMANASSLVGTLFGAGDGSTTFTLPDYTGIGFNYIIKATYATLLGDSNAEANEAFTVFMQ